MSPRPTRVFPGAWARTCERTTLRTFSLGPACRGASRTGVSIRVLTLSSVPGASGKASPVCDLHTGAQYAPVLWGEVERCLRFVEVGPATQAGVELGGVAGQDRELQAEGGFDRFVSRVASFERVEGVVEKVEDAAVGLVSTGERTHATYHAGRRLEAGEVLPDAVEAAERLRLGHGVERAAMIGDEIYAGEWFQAGSEAGFRTPDALGDRGDQASVPGVEVEDAVRLAVADGAEHDPLTLVDRHPRPPPSPRRWRSCRAAKPRH